MINNLEDKKPSNLQVMYFRMMSKFIFDNEIVSTIVYNISKYLDEFKRKMDLTINNDI